MVDMDVRVAMALRANRVLTRNWYDEYTFSCSKSNRNRICLCEGGSGIVALVAHNRPLALYLMGAHEGARLHRCSGPPAHAAFQRTHHSPKIIGRGVRSPEGADHQR